MELYILAGALFLLFFLSWKIGAFNPFSPSATSVAVFLISVLLLILGPNTLEKNISEYTFLTILLALIFFIAGELTARLVTKSTETSKIQKWMEPIDIEPRTYVIIITFSIITLVWSFIAIKDMATTVGYQEGEHLLIQYGRLATLQNEMRPNIILLIFGFLLRALSYTLTFTYLYNEILCKTRAKIRLALLLPSAVYLVQYMLWGSRGGVIEYISFFIFIYAHFKSKIITSNKILSLEIFKVSSKSLAAFFLIFIIAGSFKGWADSDIFGLISIYGGGSILALDAYLSQHNQTTSIFGSETLLGIFSLMERFNLSDIESSRILSFTAIGQSEFTNIYTSIRRYINDYGVIGMLCIQFTLGCLFTTGFLLIQKSKKIGYFTTLYSMFFMAIIYQALDEQVLTTFLSTTQIFTILFTYILHIMLIKNKLNKITKIPRRSKLPGYSLQ